MNVLLLLATVLGVGGLLLAAIILLLLGARVRAALAGGAAATWAGIYGALLLATSLLSREEVLAPGETKRFCGFYLDCHLGVAAVGHEAVATIAGAHAGGTYHVIALRFSSNARRATLKPYDLRIEMIADDARRYERARSAEDNLARARSHLREGAPPLERRIEPGGSYTVDVVFDLPEGVRPARLFVGEGLGIDRLIEGVLIGDEDSFLHRKTYLALPAGR